MPSVLYKENFYSITVPFRSLQRAPLVFLKTMSGLLMSIVT